MNLIFRRIVAAYVLVILALAWWFPAPVLIRGELIDWAERYEDRYTPPRHLWGAMELARSRIQAGAEPMPLSRFIDQAIRGQVFQATNPAWAEVFATLEHGREPGQRKLHYVRPSDDPFVDLDSNGRFVEWRDARGIRHLEYRFLAAREYEDQTIPASIRFPLREYWLVLLIGGLSLGYWGFSGGHGNDLITTSTAAMGVRGSAFCAALFSGMILWPFVHQTLGTDLSFASILIGSLLLLGAFVAIWLFSRQLAMLKALVQEGGFLAHFTYSPEEWIRFAHWNHAENASEKRVLFLMVFAIALVVGLGFMLVMQDDASVWVFGALMGFMTLLGVLVLVVPKLSLRRHSRRPGQVYVGKQCVYLSGSVHSWNTLGARFESAEYHENPWPYILLIYSQLQVAGKSLYTYRQYIRVRIPVPAGQEQAGRDIVDRLKISIK